MTGIKMALGTTHQRRFRFANRFHPQGRAGTPAWGTVPIDKAAPEQLTQPGMQRF
jgi:hypothetical protein